MMKKFLFVILAAGLLTFSCVNSINEDSDTVSSEQTCISINLSANSGSRTVRPGVVTPSDLSNFELKGQKLGSADKKTLASASTDSGFPREIQIEEGAWSFTLTAYHGTLQYYCTLDYVQIQPNQTNLLNFVLRPIPLPCGFNLSLNVTQTQIDKVVAVLSTVSGVQIDSTPFTLASDLSRTITYQRDSNINPQITPGTYHLVFNFYAGEDPTPINQWENYIVIKESIITTANVTLNFNEVYTITYLNEDGGPVTDFSGGMAFTKYSTRSHFDLPVLNRTGKIFMGWKKQGTNTIISSITTGMNENLTLNPVFADPVLYIASPIATVNPGDNSNDGFSSSTPLKSFDGTGGVIEKICEYGNPDVNWTIKVSGDITGTPRGTSGTNSNYGHIEIPAELTTDVAKSLLITGATAHSDWLDSTVPNDLDTINRGGSGSNVSLENSSFGISGAALIISTAVPVTITNLKITGASGSRGGGIIINEGATVSLGDGVLITKNRASVCGGGILNQGTLYIYGSAVIGDKDATSFPPISSSQNLSSEVTANYASNGGGIYNGDTYAQTVGAEQIISKLYLGYKPSANLIPVEETFTGGIYCNGGGSLGGGIYNAIKSELYMNSGTIARNAVDEGGGGIYNLDDGIVKMSGGNIHTNSVHQNSGIVHGGGIENHGTTSKFIMSGGAIYDNQAWGADSGTNGEGGGVYNGGYMFMYGSATIGKVPTELSTPAPASSTSYSNRANTGGGIYNSNTTDRVGRLYIGYEPADDSYTSPSPAEFTGGIYYNYSEQVYFSGSTINGGGGIYSYANNANGEFKMSSGTIAYNSTTDYGGGIYGKIVTLDGNRENTGINIHDNTAANAGNAIYIQANSSYYLSLGGNIDIPKGTGNNHDIFLGTDNENYRSKIKITSDLNGDFRTILTPGKYIGGIPLITIPSGSTANLEAEIQCFSITPQTKDDDGNTLETPVNWKLDNEGKLQIDTTPTVTVTRTDSNTITHTSGELNFELGNIDVDSYEWIALKLYSKANSEADWVEEDADEGHNFSSGDINGDKSKHFMEIRKLNTEKHIFKITFVDPDDNVLAEYPFTIE